MKNHYSVLLGSAIVLQLLALPTSAFECNVCHSKKPGMVKMHKTLQSKNISCFGCHKIGEKLMGKGQPKDPAAVMARRGSDPLCLDCHRK